MIAIIISVLAAFVTTGVLTQAWPGHTVWSILFGVLAFFLVTLVINLILKKKLEAAFSVVQKHLMDKQDYLNRKVRSIGMRATPKFQQEIEQEQAQSIREGIALLDTLKPFVPVLNKHGKPTKKAVRSAKPAIFLCTPIKAFRDKWGITVIGYDLTIGEGAVVPCKKVVFEDVPGRSEEA